MTLTPHRKKLIEVSMPLEAINIASVKAKKKAPKGYPTSFHKYWAQRPLAACRAVLFGQLVDDPCSWPDRFPTQAAQGAERERLHDVIRNMVEWPGSKQEDQDRWERNLQAARVEIARSVAWGRGEVEPKGRAAVLDYLAEHAPPIFDPFCGGGSIPLEAQRLGLRAYGSDLNPVSVLISKALVEIPPKFAGVAPVRPGAARSGLDQPWRGAQGLAEDVRHYGRWLRDQAKARIGHLYPDVTLPDGRSATVIAWLWARTVRSPDPTAKGAMVPLASSFLLSSKAGKETIVRVVRDAAASDGWRFEVQQGGVSAEDLATAREGTIGRSTGGVCALTGASMPFTYVRAEGKSGRLGVRLMAMVAEGEKSRTYLSPSAEHEATATRHKPVWKPETVLPANTRDFKTPLYGLNTYGDLFTDRQLVTLTTFADLVSEAREVVLADAKTAFAERGLPADSTALADGGRGAQAYADAVATYLAFSIDRMTEYGSTISSWLPKDNAIRSAFARQAIPMVWDYCEANYLAKSSAASETCVEVVASALERTPAMGSGQIDQLDASANGYPVRPISISTDPPYYDNIGYADLSDFFYVWLRRSIGTVWPDLFRRLQTPKTEELVATPYRAPDRAEMARRIGRDDHPILNDWDQLSPKDRAEREFMFGMRQALTAMRNAATPEVPLAIYYAFKQSEKSDDGVSSAGWASFLQAVIDSGLLVDGTWPMRTESEERLIGNNANALASSVVLVCRQRPETARTVSRRDFLAELRREMPDAVARMRAAGIHPVDIPQAALGPGMKVFSQYAAVREADDSAMPVGRAIILINQVRGEIDHAESGDMDAATRFALDWFAAYGWNAHDSGQAIQLAQSYDLTERALREAGVLVTDRGEARLVRRAEMTADWRPSRDRNLTTWELAQALNRALNDGGGVWHPACRGARTVWSCPMARRPLVRLGRGPSYDRRGARLGPSVRSVGRGRGRRRSGRRGRDRRHESRGQRRSVLGERHGRAEQQGSAGPHAGTGRRRPAALRRKRAGGALRQELATACPVS
jgi:putative DNA methylase